MSWLGARIATGAALLVLGACADNGGHDPGDYRDSGHRTLVRCQEPRPELCTQHYDPVCALRDTGIRCITIPCDSTEWVRYGNACSACADPDVIGYQPGPCEDGNEGPAVYPD